MENENQLENILETTRNYEVIKDNNGENTPIALMLDNNGSRGGEFLHKLKGRISV